jgi:hypothetical protein
MTRNLDIPQAKFVSDAVGRTPTVSTTRSIGRVSMPERGEQVQISARIPVELAVALEQSAQAADRSLSAELRRALKTYLTVPGCDRDIGEAA